ncbi:MAG: hypothetical protein J0H74_15565 [Chitinophagaceae bacterium]|nr:hypothetical protein [Chitinophagaceae bacterium]
MSTTYHIVQKQIFDISFPEEKKAFDLQSRFSHLFHNDATPVMTEVFQRLIPEEVVLRLDQLSLDLGRIRDDRLEKDFRERFRQALEKELALALEDYARRETPGRNKSLLDLLNYFLTTGMLPWWAAGELLAGPVGVVERLVRDDPAGLKSLLLDTGQRDYVRRRLVYQFPVTTIHTLVETLEPDEAPFIFAYYSDIVHIQTIEGFFRQEMSEFERQLWVFIFTYLMVDRGSNFNRKIFVKSTLAQMARQHNLEYGMLITLLFKALGSTNATLVRQSALSGIITTLYYEEEQKVEKDLPQSAASLMMEKMNIIRHYLFQDNLSGLPLFYNTSSLSEIFTQLITQAPDAIYDMIRSVSGREGIWSRIIRAFDESAIYSLVRLREPDEAEFIFHYAKRLENLQRQKFLVKTDSSGFHHSVWELILAFLWTERGNVFNSRVFLEYNIRRIARRHQLSYRQLLAFLVQGIGQDIRSERDSSLFHFLAVLLKESAEPADTTLSHDIISSADADSLSKLTSSSSDFPYPGASLSIGEWLSALTHYLVHRQWPKQWTSSGEHSEETLLQQALLRLFREDPLTLKKLLREKAPGNVMVQQSIRILFGSSSSTSILLGEDPLPPATGKTPSPGKTSAPDETHAPVETPLPPVEMPPAPYYINNAGMILLHPLLPHFFGRVGLTEKNQFIDQAAQRRAAHLLQYLVDGKHEHPEHELTLNKILCDIPIEESLPLQITLTETERTTADQLMDVLRQQWEKLKNTSTEGIRVSFLQRDGALTPMQDEWKMRVEQKGIDVLLQYLPWSWRLVRLPWMSKTLYTEWI